MIGHHDGISSFTVGQRKGLKVASPTPLYVLNIDPASHRVTVGADAELATRTLRANRVNWISIPELTKPMRVKIKIRHRHEPAWATIEPLPRADSEAAQADVRGALGAATRSAAVDAQVLAIFDEPQRAITPGQSAVFYDGDEVVGGGWIL